MSHFGPSGCLSDAGVALFRDSPPGMAPKEIADHVAGCARCQNRLLVTDRPLAERQGKGRSRRAVAPSLGKTLLLAALGLIAMLVALMTLRQLAGR